MTCSLSGAGSETPRFEPEVRASPSMPALNSIFSHFSRQPAPSIRSLAVARLLDPRARVGGVLR